MNIENIKVGEKFNTRWSNKIVEYMAEEDAYCAASFDGKLRVYRFKVLSNGEEVLYTKFGQLFFKESNGYYLGELIKI